MADRTFEVTDHDGVTVVSMGDDENRFSGPFASGLRATLRRTADPGGPLVITGGGKFFSNGLDLEWLGQQEPDASAAAFAEIYGLLADLLEYPGVVVSAINGHAFGAGVMIAAVSDIRIQREDRGFFCLPEVDLGMAMSPQFDALLRAKYPTNVVLRALLSGERHGGARSVEAGLVDETATEEELLPRAIELAHGYVEKSPETIGRIKSIQHAEPISVLRS
jgi:enoyl-CoA hydratase/carnithine racemase